ncbi:MAG: hypothetical protein QOH26_1008 [Actinomycetota bacterium]|jgi:hypothetical protein|nr:hypothetical protein [Actinomycetota bacterium]
MREVRGKGVRDLYFGTWWAHSAHGVPKYADSYQ